MNDSNMVPQAPLDRDAELDRLDGIVRDALRQARRLGADEAEVHVSASQGLSVNVRLGEVETLEYMQDRGVSVTVYDGRRKGVASSADLKPESIAECVRRATDIARYTQEDPCNGLADPGLLAREQPDLDLWHPVTMDATAAIERALACEEAGRSDSRISNSEGATLFTQRSSFVYGNSHGFIGGYPTSRHSLSCAVIAQQGDEMQRDYWYDSDRVPTEIADPASIGRRAAERALARLNGRRLGTRECPVLFSANIAPSVLRSLFGAIRGHAVYRKSTFLLDQVGEQIFPDWVNISEDPLKPRGKASAPFDNEGVATHYRDLVKDGVLQGYLLDSYAARKLGLRSTASAGGVHNARIAPSGESFDELLRDRIGTERVRSLREVAPDVYDDRRPGPAAEPLSLGLVLAGGERHPRRVPP